MLIYIHAFDLHVLSVCIGDYYVQDSMEEVSVCVYINLMCLPLDYSHTHA